jgi:hypothetical protein
MPFLIFALIPVGGVLPVILGLIIVAIAPGRTDAVVAVLREGLVASSQHRAFRWRTTSGNAGSADGLDSEKNRAIGSTPASVTLSPGETRQASRP